MAAAAVKVTTEPVAKPVTIKVSRPKKSQVTLDEAQRQAKQLVVDNYNAHHDTAKTPQMTTEAVQIVWFTYTLGNWKAIVSPVNFKGMLWEVTYNFNRSEAYIDVYRKLNNVVIAY
jgi:hypothetical protein